MYIPLNQSKSARRMSETRLFPLSMESRSWKQQGNKKVLCNFILMIDQLAANAQNRIAIPPQGGVHVIGSGTEYVWNQQHHGDVWLAVAKNLKKWSSY